MATALKGPKFSYSSHKPREPFPKDIKKFLEEQEWIFAKTFAKTWPHEYIVKNPSNRTMFYKVLRHIRQHCRVGMFYSRQVAYFDEDGWTYWASAHPFRNHENWIPLREETVLNRCSSDETFEARRLRGDLPK